MSNPSQIFKINAMVTFLWLINMYTFFAHPVHSEMITQLRVVISHAEISSLVYESKLIFSDSRYTSNPL